LLYSYWKGAVPVMERNKRNGRIRIEHLYMLLFAFFGAIGHPLGRIIVQKIHPFHLASFTLITGFISIILYMSATGQVRLFFKMKGADFFMSLGLGVFGFFLFQVFTFSALAHIPASMNAVLLSTSVIFTVIFAAVFLKEKIPVLNILGILIAFGGVFLVTFNRGFNTGGQVSLMGCLFSVLAAVFTSLYTVLGKKLLARNNPLTVTAVAVFSGILLLTLLTRFTVGFGLMASADITVWILTIVTGITLIGVAFPLLYASLKTMPASWVSIYLYLVPVFGVVLSFVILREKFTWIFWLGFFLILSGIIITNLLFKNVGAAGNREDRGRPLKVTTGRTDRVNAISRE
jgi:drug/metabolite transporter (DMT)-like permease